jgi:histidinol-phosphatase
VIVEEAGGEFTDLEGVPGPDGGSAVATNGHLHGRVLDLLKPGGPVSPLPGRGPGRVAPVRPIPDA